MKKFILPIIFLVLLSFAKYSHAQDSQTSKDCLKERHNAEYECGQIHLACVNRCSGQYIDKCIGACFDEQYKCDDVAKAEYDKCLKEKPSETSVTSSQPQDEEQIEPEKSPQQMWHPPIFVGEWLKVINGLLYLDDFIIFLWKHRTPEELAEIDRQITFIESLDEDFVWDRTGTDIDGVIQKIEDEPDLADDFFNKLNDYPKFKPPQILKERQQKEIDRAYEEQTKNYQFLQDVEIDENGKPILIQTPQGTMKLSPTSREKAILRYKGNIPVLESGQLEVLEETKGENRTRIETPTAEIFVIGTNFFVSFNSKLKDSTILVYEGQVEVKTKDGKKATISPDGDEPGMMIVSQKLSPVKIIILGLSLATVAGGVVMILKRRLISKGFIKKKK